MSMFRRRLMIAAASASPLGKYIAFEDAEVERICMENFSSDGVGVSYEDAEKVKIIPNNFMLGNTKVKTFNELRHFANLRIIGYDSFRGCSNLESIYINHIENLEGRTFENCSKLSIEINMPNLARVGQSVFLNCRSITRLKNLGNIEVINLNSINLGKNSICDYIELPATLKNLSGWDPVKAGPTLKTLICRAVVPPSLVNPCFNDSPKCTFYVPDESVDAYKTAPKWSTYADKIKPLSEYQP